MATLSTLPVELHLLWIPFLDPIGLISLSQTNRKFRSLIKPQRHHFVQRLLALELLPDFGGAIIPSVRIRDQELTPSWDDNETWEGIRFACTGCLRLLNYKHFGTGSFLRLKFQKPRTGCQAAIASQITDWSSESLKSQWLRKQRFLEREKNQEKSMKMLYTNATTLQWDRRIWPSREDAYEAAEKAALELCGTKRHRRLCNECRYQQGDFARQCYLPTRSNRGSKKTPVAQGPVRHFRTYIERYFPGLFDYVDEAGNPFDHPHRLTLPKPTGQQPECHIWMARCLGCAVWQDLADLRCSQEIVPDFLYFHPYGGWHWPGLSHDDLRCSTCVAKTYGRDAVAQGVQKFWNAVTEFEMKSVVDTWTFGWNLLGGLLDDQQCKGHHNRIEAILRGITWKVKQPPPYGFENGKRPQVDLDRSDLEDLRSRIRQCRDWIEEHWEDVERPQLLDQPYFTEWLGDYERYETFWLWIKRIRQKVDENPMILVEYVLHQNPYTRA